MGTILIAVLALVLAAVAAEYAARLWLRVAARTYPCKPFLHLDMQPDPQILPQLSARTTFKANSLGLRGREIPAGSNVFRIVMCGGSAVECLSLDEGEAWPNRVEHILSEPRNKAQLGTDDVHVLTLAKSGFTHEALGYVFPRVLNRLGRIDILTITTGMSVLNSWTLAGAPAAVTAGGTAWDDIDWHTETEYAWSPKASATAEIVRRLYQVGLRPISRWHNTGKGVAIGRTARLNATEMRDDAADPAQWIAHYELTLGQLIDTAHRYACRVVLLRQPWFDKPGPTPEEAAQFWHGFAYETKPARRKIFYSHRLMCEMFEKIDAATVRVAARHGVATVRLADALPPASEVFYDFMHLTPEGSRRAAELVAARLMELETGEIETVEVEAGQAPARATVAGVS